MVLTYYYCNYRKLANVSTMVRVLVEVILTKCIMVPRKNMLQDSTCPILVKYPKCLATFFTAL